MKVHWWTYNHCLFVSYLTSVAFGYGWISDNKFQKFSDKHWIWIFINLSVMDQELKNEYPLTSAGYIGIRGVRTQVFSSPTPVLIQEVGILIRIL